MFTDSFVAEQGFSRTGLQDNAVAAKCLEAAVARVSR
jgi:hypothetical protein